jgi:hypothetical protein
MCLNVVDWSCSALEEIIENGFITRIGGYHSGFEEEWYSWPMSVHDVYDKIRYEHQITVSESQLDSIPRPHCWLKSQVAAGWQVLRNQLEAGEEVWLVDTQIL